MYQVIKAALTPTNASKLTQLLQVKTKLTVNEAEIVILIGFAIKYSQDYEDVKKFLKFLPFMNDIEITGLPAENASVVLTGFILQYYKTIYMLLENLEKAHSYIAQCISSHIFQKKEAVLLNFIQNSKKNEMFGIEIEAWALSPFISLNLANSLMQTIYYRYLRGRKINIQFTTLHTKIIALILAIIRNQPEIITAESSVISEVFKITFKFANKFLDKKISSKKLFVICVEFQLYCVTFQDILELSLTNFNLRSVYGKYPLIKCWLYYSVHLITMQNESILLEVLNLYQMYLPKIFEDYNEKIVAGYIEILMICQVYVREYTETLLGLVVETIRSKPDCLDVYKKNLGSLPGFIRDTATWECVFLSKEVFPMPALTPNCFNNVQSPEEALCVFVIVSNKITQFSCEELKTLLQELSKINFAFELLEFLCDRFVDFIKRLEKIGVFNRHKKSEQKLTILIKAMGAKTNCVQPSQLFNVFWTYLFHLHVQTGFDIMEVTNDLSRIAEKTLWSDCVVFGNISPQYFYKVNQKLKGLYESGSYDELLGVYINCEILKMQHQSENFINYCLNSKLPHKIQDVLLGEYFLSMKRKKYSPGRVKNDLTCLIKFIAANKRRKFIESIVDIDSFSSLESCYCYEFLQILADFDFFRFSFNLLGCASLKKTNVFLRHTGEILVIERPSEFYKFFLGFVTKSFGYAINIARKEVSFCCAMFLSESVNNEEDRASKEFIRIFLQYFTKAKVSEKLYDDLHLFHKWFVGKYKDVGCLMQGKSFCDQKDKKIADKEEKNNLGGNEKTLGEVEKEINLLSEVLNSPADPIKVQVKFLLFRKNTEEEFNKGINKLILDIFDSLEKLQDGLLYLTWIVSKFPDYNLEIFKEFEINILEYLSKNKAPIILNSSKKIGLVNSMPNLQKEPYITESSILLIVKFLKQQFHQSTLNQKNCNVAIGKIFEKIIMKHRNFTGPSLLKLCIACLKLSKSKYNLPNTYQLHSLSIQALFTLQIPDFNIQQVLSSSYITLLKVLFI